MSSLNSLWQEKGGLDVACWLWMPWLGSDTCHFYHSPLVETIDMLPSHLESFLGGSAVNNPPAMQETPVWFPGSGSSPGERIGYPFQDSWASLVAQMVKNLPAMQETWVQSWVGKIPWRRENSMDSIVHGVTKNQTRLKDFYFQKTLISNTHICNKYNVRCGTWYLTALLGDLEDSVLKSMFWQSAWKM